MEPKNMKDLDCEVLIELYMEQNKTAKEIASMYNCPEYKIKNWLKVCHIKKSKEQKCKSGLGKFLTPEYLRHLYEDLGLNMNQIAEKISKDTGKSISRPAIAAHFKRGGMIIDRAKCIASRRVNPKSIEALKKYRPKWEDWPIDRQEKFKRAHGLGGNKHSVKTKMKMSISGAIRMSRNRKPNTPEKVMMGILDKMGIKYIFNAAVSLLIDAYKSDDELGMCVDFLIFQKYNPNIKWPLMVVQVDSRYFHNLDENIKRDNLQNKVLINHLTPVIRLWDDELTYEKAYKIIQHTLKMEVPALVRYYYPEEYRKKCPAEYIKRNEKIVEERTEWTEQVLKNRNGSK